MALSHVWKNPRHQARQRQSVVPAGVRASHGCKGVAAIRISGDFKPSPVRMAKRRFTTGTWYIIPKCTFPSSRSRITHRKGGFTIMTKRKSTITPFEEAHFRFGLIAPVIQNVYPDTSARAYYRRVTEKPILCPDGIAYNGSYGSSISKRLHGL